MEHPTCPECGSTSLLVQEWQVQEIDLFSLACQPEEMLREYECQECGWSASRVISAMQPAGLDW